MSRSTRPLHRFSRLATAGALLASGLALAVGVGVASAAIVSVDLTSVPVSPSSSTYGQSVTWTATVSTTGTPGTVSFSFSSDGGSTYSPITACGPHGLSGAGPYTVTCVVPSLPVVASGQLLVEATYSGDASNSNTPVTSTPVTYTVAKANPTAPQVNLTASPNSPVAAGTSVTLHATIPYVVASGVALPTGTVAFKFSTDGSTFTTVPACGAVTVSAAAATCVTTSVPAGTTAVDAVYTGDANYTAGTSVTVAYSVKLASTVSVVASPTSPVRSGTTVTMTATNGSGQTGQDSFAYSLDGVNYVTIAACSAQAISGTTATCSTALLPAGTRDLEVTYLGDATHATATSTPLAYAVSGTGASSIALAASPNSPVAFGTTVSLIATVGTGQTGTVAFATSPDGVTFTTLPACAAQAIVGVTSSCVSAALPNGTRYVEALYSGDGTHAAVTSALVAFSVTGAAVSAVTLTASPAAPVAYGTAVTLSADLGAGPTGTVAFQYSTNGTGFAVVPGCAAQVITNHVATCVTTSLIAGTVAVRALYGGDTVYAPSTSAVVSYSISGRTAASLTMAATPVAPVTPGTVTTLTATVGAGQTGTVAFQYSLDGSTYTTLTTCAAVSIVGLSATCTTAALPAGTLDVRVVYSGDVNFASVTSPALAYRVQKAAGAVTLAATPSTRVRVGTTVTLRVGVPSGATGTVALQYSSDGVGFRYVADCLSVAVVGAVATCTTASLPAGTRFVRALYSGDAGFAPNASARVALAVSSAPSSATLSSFAGTSAVLSASMKAQIRAFAVVVANHHNSLVTVKAFGRLGTVAASRTLSAHRAAAVAAYLRSALASVGAGSVKVVTVAGGRRGGTVASSNVVFVTAS